MHSLILKSFFLSFYRETVSERLKDQPDGTFVVLDSKWYPGEYSLTLRQICCPLFVPFCPSSSLVEKHPRRGTLVHFRCDCVTPDSQKLSKSLHFRRKYATLYTCFHTLFHSVNKGFAILSRFHRSSKFHITVANDPLIQVFKKNALIACCCCFLKTLKLICGPEWLTLPFEWPVPLQLMIQRNTLGGL